MRRRIQVAGAATLALLLAGGCAKKPAATAPTESATPISSSVTTRYATHVFVGECVFAPPGAEAAIAPLGALLSSAIGEGLNLIGRALRATGKEHTWHATASANFEAAEPRNGSCVQVVRGAFALTPKADMFAWTRNSEPFKSVAADLQIAGILLDAPPDFFFEGRVRNARTPDGVFAIAPVVVGFAAPIGTRALRGDTRSVLLTFAFHAPNTPATDAKNPSTQIVLGELVPGTWMQFDTECSTPSAGFRCADESAWVSLPRGTRDTPMTLTAVVSEVQGKSAFLTFLADVFEGSQDDLEKAAKIALMDAEREKARLASLEIEIESSSAADKALTAAIVALEACSQDGSAAKAGDALVKQQSANLAAAKAGRTPPFAATIRLGLTGDANKTRCAEALAPFRDGALE